MVSLTKPKPAVNRHVPSDTIPCLIRDGDSWRQIDHDLSGFPHYVGTIRAGFFTCEVRTCDPFQPNDFVYLVAVDCHGAELVLLRGLAELLDFVRELRGLTR